MLYEKHKHIPGYHNIETTNAVELQMQTIVRKHAPIGLLDRANRVWRYTKNGKMFGDSFAEATPRSWAKNYMAYNTVKILTKHVIPPMQRAEKATRGIPLTVILGERNECRIFQSIAQRTFILYHRWDLIL